jgi:putative oxidoreductase
MLQQPQLLIPAFGVLYRRFAPVTEPLIRVVAAPIMGFLVVAIVTYHWQFGFAWENRGIEYSLFWSIVVLHSLVRGGGPWSLGALIGREL